MQKCKIRKTSTIWKSRNIFVASNSFFLRKMHNCEMMGRGFDGTVSACHADVFVWFNCFDWEEFLGGIFAQ